MIDKYAISALTHLLKLVIGRGKVQTVKDDGPVQILQVILSAKETPTIKRVAEFGFTSWPMENADAIVVFVGGDRSNGVIIGTNDQQHRLQLQNAGEAAIFDAFGKSIWLKKDTITIEANNSDVLVNNAQNVTVTASTKVKIDCPNVELTGDLKVDGDIKSDGDITDATRSMAADRNIYDSHTHPAGSPNTGPPNQQE